MRYPLCCVPLGWVLWGCWESLPYRWVAALARGSCILWAFWVATACAGWCSEPPPTKTYEPTSAYCTQQIEGWTVFVHRDLLTNHKSLGDDVLELLRVKLYDIRRAIPPRALTELRKIPIWVERNNPKVTCACYHPSRRWLEEHGFNPQKAGAVEIGNAQTFLNWSRQQPSMVLHELAHAYHHRVLGWDHPEVKAAYQEALKRKGYDSVLGSDGKKRRHYALNDAKEYFAESSEAYFGTNDFYPFVRPELLHHDPAMAALLQRLWENPPAPATAPCD